MRRIKKTEFHPNCKWCWPSALVPAVWCGEGLTRVKHACEAHRPQLEAWLEGKS